MGFYGILVKAAWSKNNELKGADVARIDFRQGVATGVQHAIFGAWVAQKPCDLIVRKLKVLKPPSIAAVSVGA